MASMNLPVVIALSMTLNHSGHMLNEGLQNSMVFHEKLFIYTLKNANLDSTIERKAYMIEYLLC